MGIFILYIIINIFLSVEVYFFLVCSLEGIQREMILSDIQFNKSNGLNSRSHVTQKMSLFKDVKIFNFMAICRNHAWAREKHGGLLNATQSKCRQVTHKSLSVTFDQLFEYPSNIEVLRVPCTSNMAVSHSQFLEHLWMNDIFKRHPIPF